MVAGPCGGGGGGARGGGRRRPGRPADGAAARATADGAAARSGAADGDDARPVPACAADAQRLADGAAPDVRIVSVGGRPTPYWDVPVLYGPLLVGYYDRSAAPSVWPALLRGTPLGDALAADR